MSKIIGQTGIVVSVNVSEDKGQRKLPVECIVLDQYGIQGDAHAGDWHRQVSLLSKESIDRFQTARGIQVAAGQFGENIAVSGLDLQTVGILDRLSINKVELEVTQVGKACHGDGCSIYKEVGECIMPKEGIFCRVRKGGEIKPDQSVLWQPRAIKVAVITVSDRASRGEYEDRSGPIIEKSISTFLEEHRWHGNIEREILPDQEHSLRNRIQSLLKQGYDAIFTTGGTGIGPNDITPDVVESLADKLLPGVMEYIRCKYGESIPNALLSRSVAAVAEGTVIYALPGSVKAVEEYMSEILRTFEHTLFMMRGLDTH